MGSHYSNAQEMGSLVKNSKLWAEKVVKAAESRNAMPVLVYSGMSGIASATALAMQIDAIDPGLDVAMVYVRKDNENSHGSPVEYNVIEHNEERPFFWVFVDDFVCTGTTYARCMYKVMKEFFPKKMKSLRHDHVFFAMINESPNFASGPHTPRMKEKYLAMVAKKGVCDE